MGRSSVIKTPLERKTVRLSAEIKTGTGGGDTSFYGVPYSSAQLVSATASVTLLSLQGPGIVNFLEIGNVVGHPTKLSVYIDGETAFSATCSLATGAHYWMLIGEWGAYAQFDSVLFYDKFLVTAESPSATQPTINLAYAWRLSNG